MTQEEVSPIVSQVICHELHGQNKMQANHQNTRGRRPFPGQPICDFCNRSRIGAVVAQLASARLSEREVPCSIFSDFNVCFDFPLIRVAIALNTNKTEQ